MYICCTFDCFSFNECFKNRLNISVARIDVTRASLLKLMNVKTMEVFFFNKKNQTKPNKQTKNSKTKKLSDSENEHDWRKEQPGEVILSHNTYNSGGVAVLFSKSLTPFSFEVEEIMSGHSLKFKVHHE